MATASPELISDVDNCKPDISNGCGRPRLGALQADEGYLLLDYIYSTSYDTAPKRYLTSFAVTRDFFHGFFGTMQDDLDQQPNPQIPRDSHSRPLKLHQKARIVVNFAGFFGRKLGDNRKPICKTHTGGRCIIGIHASGYPAMYGISVRIRARESR